MKVRYEVDDGVATITLDDPETRNSLSNELLEDLTGALSRARDDGDVRAVVLTSSHDRVFSPAPTSAASATTCRSSTSTSAPSASYSCSG